jgi:hypothetical protein
LNFNKEDEATQKLQQTAWYRNLERTILEAANNDGLTSVDTSGSDSLYGEADFKYAFGKVEYRFSASKVVGKKWMSTLRISDTYDFEEHKAGMEKFMGGLGSLLNEYGYNAQIN